MSNLLDQAIIDAEALKEVALRNAEATVLDKFSDQIKEAVQQILEVEEDVFGDVEDESIEGQEFGALEAEEDPEDPEVDLPLANAEGLELCACPDETQTVHIDLQSLESDLEAGEEPGTLEDTELMGDEEGPLETIPENLELDEGFLKEMSNKDTYTEMTLEEDLLDELAQMVEASEGDPSTMLPGLDYDPIENPIPGLDQPMAVPVKDLPTRDVGDPRPGPTTQPAAKSYPKAPKGIPSKTAPSTPPIKGSGWKRDVVDENGESLEINEEDLNEVVEEALTVDVDIKTLQSGWGTPPESVFRLAEEELLAMLQDSKVREEWDAKRKALKNLEESSNKLQTDVNKLTSDKKELLGVTNRLKDKLSESNLANAKLLYTNKVLMSDSLNERQKNKIVEALSNSESVEEAKIIYETLQSATGSTIKNNKPESLSEAMNKTTSTLILSHRNRDRENKTIQNDSSIDRWKILAGLNKK